MRNPKMDPILFGAVGLEPYSLWGQDLWPYFIWGPGQSINSSVRVLLNYSDLGLGKVLERFDLMVNPSGTLTTHYVRYVKSYVCFLTI